MGRPFPNERVFLLDEEDRLVDRARTSRARSASSAPAWRLATTTTRRRRPGPSCKTRLRRHFPRRCIARAISACSTRSGRFVYRGRKDHQIKHLGQRIELGEIDAAAHGVEGVDPCVHDLRARARSASSCSTWAHAIRMPSPSHAQGPPAAVHGSQQDSPAGRRCRSPRTARSTARRCWS